MKQEGQITKGTGGLGGSSLLEWPQQNAADGLAYSTVEQVASLIVVIVTDRGEFQNLIKLYTFNMYKLIVCQYLNKAV